MFSGIKNYIKRRNLKMQARAIEDAASQKRQWGNNLTTALITTTLVCENLDLLNVSNFIDNKKSIVIQSYFGNFGGMFAWLNDVNILLTDIAHNGVKQIPDDKADLKVSNKFDISLLDFSTNNGVSINLVEKYHKISKMMLNMEKSLDNINPNMRDYLDIRLSNGLNTLIIFNEQLLEVMMNG